MNHTIKFGPHFRIIVSKSKSGGIFLEYTHHGFDLLSDPDGTHMQAIFRIAARYNQPSLPGVTEFSHFDILTASGYGFAVYKRASRTYFVISKDQRFYTLDATVPGGQLEKFINAVRRKFPDRCKD